MSRLMAAALFASVGAAMASFVAFVHGDLVGLAIAGNAAAAGLVVYLAGSSSKNFHFRSFGYLIR
jgi:hypothetical protein